MARRKNAKKATQVEEVIVEETIEETIPEVETPEEKKVEESKVEKLNEEEDIEVKQAITSKQGKKVTKKETIRQAMKNDRVQEEQKKPTSNKEQTYKVLSNLKRDGDVYKEGDTLTAKPCAEIETLLEIGVIK